MLDSVLFELSSISHVINIAQETAQDLSRDLMLVVRDKMTQIKYSFRRKVQVFSFTLTLDYRYLQKLIKYFEIKPPS